jgi:hypothetical protein
MYLDDKSISIYIDTKRGFKSSKNPELLREHYSKGSVEYNSAISIFTNIKEHVEKQVVKDFQQDNRETLLSNTLQRIYKF